MVEDRARLHMHGYQHKVTLLVDQMLVRELDLFRILNTILIVTYFRSMLGSLPTSTSKCAAKVATSCHYPSPSMTLRLTRGSTTPT